MNIFKMCLELLTYVLDYNHASLSNGISVEPLYLARTNVVNY